VAWWVWVLLAWAAVAGLLAIWFGIALRTSEARDWARRGPFDRRKQPRQEDFEAWVARGRPERRTTSPQQERAFVAARAEAGHERPDRRRRRSD